MIIHTANFVKSSSNFKQCPDNGLPEYAFVGRSNVGKSSLINRLTNRKGLAKTSSKPGKTSLINHFIINDEWYLVDLPGYGYAKVSKTQRAKYQKLIDDYLLKRQALTCLFLLIDSRHEPLKADLEFMEWLALNGIPFVICFTKADKLSANQLNESISRYKSALTESWEELPTTFITSAEKGNGMEEILDFVEKTNKSLS